MNKKSGTGNKKKRPERLAEARPGDYAGSSATRKPKSPVKRATNLTLDPEAVARGEQFSARTGTSLSKLVSAFLLALPAEQHGDALKSLSPAVRRLYGMARNAKDVDATEEYRGHLRRKYGAR